MSDKPVRVVIAEDEALIRLDLKEMLEEEGYVGHTAENGQVALELLQVIARPCLILLDLMMPVMSGAEFLSHLRQAKALRN